MQCAPQGPAQHGLGSLSRVGMYFYGMPGHFLPFLMLLIPAIFDALLWAEELCCKNKQFISLFAYLYFK